MRSFRIWSTVAVAVWTTFPSAPRALGAGTEWPAFQKLTLTGEYYCDGINTGDFNHDGRPDIVAGPFWYEGPGFTNKHEFYPASVFPTRPAPTDSMFSYVWDFNGDGWPDILVLGRVHLHAAYWYENPRSTEKKWRKHLVCERVKGESPPFLDVDGDGKPELITHVDNQWGLMRPDWEAPERPWRFQPVTAAGSRVWEQFYHGTGVGDVNGDGRLDLILNDGWWEQPEGGTQRQAQGGALWAEHPFVFSKDKGGAQMFAYDVNGDGLADIITALNAHGWGLAWFEQIKRGAEITFAEHTLMLDRSAEARYGVCFSQPHALALADLDGDGLRDIVVGKRMWAHPPPKDIEPDAPPVLYGFQLVRGSQYPGRATFKPRLIDERSGVGVQVTVVDVTSDRRPDILTVSKLGTFVFVSQDRSMSNPR